MTRKKSASMPASDMQWRARKIAMQASRLADQAGPMTRKAAFTARRSAVDASDWARPRVGRARAWMAIRAARGSVSVQETVAPKVSSVLAAAARRLDPPKQRSRRWPKVLAGTAVLAAAGAAATAMVLRKRPRGLTSPLPPRPAARDSAEQSVKMVNPNGESERDMSEADLNGLSRTR
jgi:hypothetical protein